MGVDVPQRSQLFQRKEAAARHYYSVLDLLNDDEHPDVVKAKGELDEVEERFIDDPAYVAFLRLKREAVR